jgi:hypothetical protein
MRTANEEEVSAILRDLYADNLIESDEFPDEYHYNCWGFVAKENGFDEDLYWMSDDRMEEYLEEKSHNITEPKAGDIAVFRSGSYLLHTAIIYEVGETPDDMKFIHKPGGWELEIIDMEDMIAVHGNTYGTSVAEYRRSNSRGGE